jgi:hypothetical protein
VRSIVVLMLMGMILACPFVCGLGEDACASDRHHHGERPGTPNSGHCPEDADDCICRGAVQLSTVKAPDIDAIGVPLLLQHLSDAPAHFSSHLTSDGHPAGLAGWGDSLAVRALLQNFRC